MVQNNAQTFYSGVSTFFTLVSILGNLLKRGSSNNRPTMTGMLIDSASSLFVCVSSILTICHCLSTNETTLEHVWTSASESFLVISGLILAWVVPVFFQVDKDNWQWPFKRHPSSPKKPEAALSGLGGPPRNSWPRHARFAYSNQNHTR
tara:strand:- start:42 stop:488 length:447 start_codon:yes stop_codon:yes gene_type:complete